MNKRITCLVFFMAILFLVTSGFSCQKNVTKQKQFASKKISFNQPDIKPKIKPPSTNIALAPALPAGRQKKSVAPSQSNQAKKNTSLVNKQAQVTVTLKIDNSKGEKTFKEAVGKNSTVYDLLRIASKEHHFSLKGTNYSYGVFIEEIAGTKNDPSSNMYWLYYINKNLANLGASSQKVKQGDVILWKFQKTN